MVTKMNIGTIPKKMVVNKFKLAVYKPFVYNKGLLRGNNMAKDRKKKPKQRNMIAVLAWTRKAGSHDKPYKSQRGKLNREWISS